MLWARAGRQALSEVLDKKKQMKESLHFTGSLIVLLRLYHANCFAMKTCSEFYDDNYCVCSEIACRQNLLRLVTSAYKLCLNKVAVVSLSFSGASPFKAKKLYCEDTWVSITFVLFCFGIIPINDSKICADFNSRAPPNRVNLLLSENFSRAWDRLLEPHGVCGTSWGVWKQIKK